MVHCVFADANISQQVDRYVFEVELNRHLACLSYSR